MLGCCKRGQQLRLLPVAGQLPLVGQKLLMDLLDGHLAPQLAVAGTIDRGESRRRRSCPRFRNGPQVPSRLPLPQVPFRIVSMHDLQFPIAFPALFAVCRSRAGRPGRARHEAFAAPCRSIRTRFWRRRCRGPASPRGDSVLEGLQLSGSAIAAAEEFPLDVLPGRAPFPRSRPRPGEPKSDQDQNDRDHRAERQHPIEHQRIDRLGWAFRLPAVCRPPAIAGRGAGRRPPA